MPTISSPAMRRRDTLNADDTFAASTALPHAKASTPADTLPLTPTPVFSAILRSDASEMAAGADAGAAPASALRAPQRMAFRTNARNGLDRDLRRHAR